MNKNRFILFTIFCGLLVFGFTATNSFAQERGDENTVINLTQNARQNGYKIIEKENTVFIQAINVIDPITKKRLAGVKDLRVRCKERDELMKIVGALFENGTTGRLRTSCETRESRPVTIFIVAVYIPESQN